jgi:cytochrome P450
MLEILFEIDVGRIALLLLGFLIGYSTFKALADPLRHVPGPFLARFTRLWYVWEVYKGTVHLTSVRLHRKYGPVVRLAPHMFSIDDPEAAKVIYGMGTPFVKSRFYSAFMVPEGEADPSRANLFGDQDPVHHGLQRRKYASLYSMSSLLGYEPLVDECTGLIVHRFQELAAAGQKVPLGWWLQCYAFDVISYITFGNRFGLLDAGVDKANIVPAVEGRLIYGSFVGFFPSLHKYLMKLMPKTGGYGYMLKFSKEQMDLSEKKLREGRNTNRVGPPDGMSKLLTAHGADPEKITKTDIFNFAASNIGAGADTTAITLSAIMGFLVKDSQSYKRLQDELDDAAAKGLISDPITFKEACDLPYLQAVIKEALRMHSAVGALLQRVVPPEGVIFAGVHFPGGVTVGIDAWVAHRNTSVYGPDADIWRPSRWLEYDEEGRGAEIEKYFFAFGMGTRSCIGRNISMLEMCKVIPTLMRKFDFKLEDEGRHFNRWFVYIKDFDGRVSVRSKNQGK